MDGFFFDFEAIRTASAPSSRRVGVAATASTRPHESLRASRRKRDGLATVSINTGYEALFTQKSREAMGAAGKVDGCATFWKAQKYRVAEQRELRFNDLAYAEARSRRPFTPSTRRVSISR